MFMPEQTDRLYSSRKIGVCGSSRNLPKGAVEFCKALGARLAAEPHMVIVASGTGRSRLHKIMDDYAAEYHIVKAAEHALLAGKADVSKRIITVVREDLSDTSAFRVGTLRHPRGKTSEARRIAFVHDVDALIAIAGREGTEQELAFAMELHI